MFAKGEGRWTEGLVATQKDLVAPVMEEEGLEEVEVLWRSPGRQQRQASPYSPVRRRRLESQTSVNRHKGKGCRIYWLRPESQKFTTV